ncbi:MAG: extracellular solute-binding protein [Treponema sp.]|jgi:putative aldouronate transport system substrate-binding protein|nr:extracellular solute-binding protein [Treponema sp.]
MKKTVTFLLVAALTSVVAFAGGQQGSGHAGQPAAAGTPAKISVEIFDRGTDGGKTNPTDNQWTKWIHDKLLKDENIDVSFVAVPRWTEAESLVNLFAAGNPPDVCYSYSNDNIQTWASMGGIHDVSPYINTILKDLNAFLGTDEAIPGARLIERTKNLETGAIYSMPAKRMNVARSILWIREDWLTILGLPVPTTTEEYHRTLLAFRDRADEIMKATGVDRVVPTTVDKIFIPSLILDTFVNVNVSDKERWIHTVIDRGFLVPGYKEGVRFVNQLYSEGLIDPDFPLYGSDYSAGALMRSGIIGSWSGDWDDTYREPNGVLSSLKKNISNANIIPVDCLTDANGKTAKSIYDRAGVFYFIPASSKNPEAAARYLNWMAKYENYHFIQTGHEGITHTIGSDGVIKLDPNALKDPSWIMNSNQNIDYTMPMNGLFMETDEASIRALAAGYTYPADLIQRAYEVALTNGQPSLVVQTASPLLAAGPYVQVLTAKVATMFTAMVMCSPSQFDSVWDSSIKDWLSSGAQAIIDERQAKYPK